MTYPWINPTAEREHLAKLSMLYMWSVYSEHRCYTDIVPETGISRAGETAVVKFAAKLVLSVGHA